VNNEQKMGKIDQKKSVKNEQKKVENRTKKGGKPNKNENY
jgi:hypothetical protein